MCNRSSLTIFFTLFCSQICWMNVLRKQTDNKKKSQSWNRFQYITFYTCVTSTRTAYTVHMSCVHMLNANIHCNAHSSHRLTFSQCLLARRVLKRVIKNGIFSHLHVELNNLFSTSCFHVNIIDSICLLIAIWVIFSPGNTFKCKWWKTITFIVDTYSSVGCFFDTLNLPSCVLSLFSECLTFLD